jgi:hypothetical protein
LIKIDKKFLLPFPACGRQAKYGSSRFIFRFFGSLECAAESLRIYSPPPYEPREARRANSVRAILRIHRSSGFRKWKTDASRRETRRSARIWKGFLGKKEKDLSMKGKRNFLSILI